MGEVVAEDLGVLVGQRAGIHVVAAEGITLEVGVANPGDSELVELVVPADAYEADPVVDLAHLAQRVGRVLGTQENTLGVRAPDGRPTASDALAGVVRFVLHQLLGRDVHGHGHRTIPDPPGCVWFMTLPPSRSSRTAVRSDTRWSSRRSKPLAVIEATIG